ncbi:MAG: membrane protein insertion efficiency factor YidD [Alphaproteobacteria bacterium]|nr:membrane protein insertion efficiency factor YidD [Alphaproteobacteria bacterium]
MRRFQFCQRLVIKSLLTVILFYRLCLSPLIGPSCRFLPSCSDYALKAIRIHGSLKGVWLTLKRIARCHPWGSKGLDVVPPRT